MKQVELKKYEFEYPGMSRLEALSGISVSLGCHCMEENHGFFEEYSTQV